jgi:ACS family tartrate transporter-like MFS transporter
VTEPHSIESQTTRTVIRRIGLFVLIVTLLNTLDRVNVGFAALTMNGELGFDPKVFGWGVGLFFLTYIPAQIPMTALGQRLGPARALPMMMVAWGLIAASMGAVTGVVSFFVLRLLLGIAEAAAAPMVLYLQSQWIPQHAVGRYSMVIALALPGSFILGAPLSGWLMTSFQDVGALSGWRWMFIIEGAATILFGLTAWLWLPQSPRAAGWLTEPQKDWLEATLRHDSRADHYGTARGGRWNGLLTTIRDRKIWVLAACFFCSTVGFYTLLFWLPQVVQDLVRGAGAIKVTLISVLPWLGVMAGVLLVGWHSDRRNERYVHVAGAALIGAVGMASVALLAGEARWAIAGLIVGGFGVGAAQIVFWTIPMGELRGAHHSATAFAFINLIGNIAGLIGAPLIGYLREATQSFTAPILVIAVFLLIEAAILLRLRPALRSLAPAAPGPG